MPKTDDFDDTFTHDNFFKTLTEYTEGEKIPGLEKNSEGELAPVLTFLHGPDFMAQVYPEQQWLIDRLIPAQGLVCLSGMPSSYKSWLGFYIALCVMKGQPLFEDKFLTQKGAVLFIDKENIERNMQERFRMLGADAEMESCHFVQGNFSTENLRTLAAVVDFVKRNNKN